MTPLYDIEVQLSGEDGNAFAIIGAVQRAIRRHLQECGVDGKESHRIIEEYHTDVMSGDYDHVIQVSMKYVNVI